MDSLDDVAQAVRVCTDCPLHSGRTHAVPGEGNAASDIMFIGEGPGFHEDRQGRPFVGPAGQLLEGLLASIGTNRDEVFIANMVKCRPPDNRDPQPSEISACAKYLDRQIELINPKLIVTLGRFSLGRFFPGESITRARGKVRTKDGRRIFPVMHPAAALRRPELRTIMVEDFRAISSALTDSAEPDSQTVELNSGTSAVSAPEADPDPQLDLFGAVVPSAASSAPEPSLENKYSEDPADSDMPEGPLGPQQLSMF